MKILEGNKYGRLDISDLVAFEAENNITLPSDYRRFLIEYNGGQPSPNRLPNSTDVAWLYGFHHNPEGPNLFYAIDVFQDRIPSWYMPIGCDSFGNQFLMSLYSENYGLIAFWDHETESPTSGHQYFDNMREVADSFTEFLNFLVE